MKIALIFLVLSVLSEQAIADRSVCGNPPPDQFREENNETIKGDVEGKANLLFRFVGQSELSGKIEATRKEIFAKYPDANKAYMDRYLVYMFCTLIFDPKNEQSTEQKLKALREFKLDQKPNDNSSIYPEDRWKSTVLQEIKLGLNKDHVHGLIGLPKVKVKLGKSYPDQFQSIILERYEDENGEVQILYDNDDVLVGLEIKHFADENSQIIKSSFLKYRILTGEKEWELGKSTFSDLENSPIFATEDDFRKSACHIEKHYFGKPGGYSDYYFSVWLTGDSGNSKKPELRVPNSLLVVNSAKVCNEKNTENITDNINSCDDLLLRLTCTWGEDFTG